MGLLVALALSVGAAAAVHAHEGEEEIVVEPASVTSGDPVILAGTGLEADNDRIIVLAGQNLVVEFGTVTTDAQGLFQADLTIPSHLPSGTYEFRAIGDETLTVPLAITAADGFVDASPAPDVSGTVMPRERTTTELAVILAFAALAAVAGGLLVWRAERRRATGA